MTTSSSSITSHISRRLMAAWRRPPRGRGRAFERLAGASLACWLALLLLQTAPSALGKPQQQQAGSRSQDSRKLQDEGGGFSSASTASTASNGSFQCPEQFGYYTDTRDCTKYFVCVFGEVLHESCTGGLRFSRELQTCDWPRNVNCPQLNASQPTQTGAGQPAQQRAKDAAARGEDADQSKAAPALVSFADEGSDPQQPSFDEAVAPVITPDGTIHLHDGSGGTYSLTPNQNHNRAAAAASDRPGGRGESVDVFVKPLTPANTRPNQPNQATGGGGGSGRLQPAQLPATRAPLNSQPSQRQAATVVPTTAATTTPTTGGGGDEASEIETGGTEGPEMGNEGATSGDSDSASANESGEEGAATTDASLGAQADREEAALGDEVAPQEEPIAATTSARPPTTGYVPPVLAAPSTPPSRSSLASQRLANQPPASSQLLSVSSSRQTFNAPAETTGGGGDEDDGSDAGEPPKPTPRQAPLQLPLGLPLPQQARQNQTQRQLRLNSFQLQQQQHQGGARFAPADLLNNVNFNDSSKLIRLQASQFVGPALVGGNSNSNGDGGNGGASDDGGEEGDGPADAAAAAEQPQHFPKFAQSQPPRSQNVLFSQPSPFGFAGAATAAATAASSPATSGGGDNSNNNDNNHDNHDNNYQDNNNGGAQAGGASNQNINTSQHQHRHHHQHQQVAHNSNGNHNNNNKQPGSVGNQEAVLLQQQRRPRPPKRQQIPSGLGGGSGGATSGSGSNGLRQRPSGGRPAPVFAEPAGAHHHHHHQPGSAEAEHHQLGATTSSPLQAPTTQAAGFLLPAGGHAEPATFLESDALAAPPTTPTRPSPLRASFATTPAASVGGSQFPPQQQPQTPPPRRFSEPTGGQRNNQGHLHHHHPSSSSAATNARQQVAPVTRGSSSSQHQQRAQEPSNPTNPGSAANLNPAQAAAASLNNPHHSHRQPHHFHLANNQGAGHPTTPGQHLHQHQHPNQQLQPHQLQQPNQPHQRHSHLHQHQHHQKPSQSSQTSGGSSGGGSQQTTATATTTTNPSSSPSSSSLSALTTMPTTPTGGNQEQQQQDPQLVANRYLNSAIDALEAGQPFGTVDYDFDILNDNSTERRHPPTTSLPSPAPSARRQAASAASASAAARPLAAGAQSNGNGNNGNRLANQSLALFNSNANANKQRQPLGFPVTSTTAAAGNQAEEEEGDSISLTNGQPSGGGGSGGRPGRPAANGGALPTQPPQQQQQPPQQQQQQVAASPQAPTRKPRPTNKKIVVNHEQALANQRASVEPARRPDALFATPTPLQTATKCDQRHCRLPDCKCGDTLAPGGLDPKSIPQVVLLTFDDAVNDLNWEIYEELFTGRVNPNGCPILATFYVSHEWTDYGQVQTLYSRGHEMASHSITHSFGEKFSKSQWIKEINGQREILNMYGGVRMQDVRGMRAPFLQIGGNKMFEMLYDANFTYDSSMPIFDNSPPLWPYTLDYQLAHECMITPCPTKSFPGVWEVGMTMWVDLRGGRCSMGDACSNPPDEDGVYEMLMKNFNRHYKSNRAPFGLFYHSAWFNTVHHRRGFLRFLATVNALSDVYFVTNWQMLQWMRQPTPLSEINSFEPWQCPAKSDRPPPCFHPSVCNVKSEHGTRFMKTCQPCPANQQYPWVGSTGFKAKQAAGSSGSG